jgi:hypothetical protein
VAVARVEHGDAAGEIDVSFALTVPDLRVLGAFDEEGRRGGHASGYRCIPPRSEARVIGHGFSSAARRSWSSRWLALHNLTMTWRTVV